MTSVVDRYAISATRKQILVALLDYRNDLRSIGLTEGYQWIDGSFVEDCENIRSRPPKDVDVVTIVRRPIGHKENLQWSEFFGRHVNAIIPRAADSDHPVDAYLIDLDKNPDYLVEDTAYWYGLFSHQRATSIWKGMLKIPLVSDDEAARMLLQTERNDA